VFRPSAGRRASRAPFQFGFVALSCLLACLVVSRTARADGNSAQNEPEENVRPEPQRVSGAVTLDPPLETRLLAPPFLREQRGDVRTTAFFPFYFERKSSDTLERLVVPYYYKRSPSLNVDVPLGLVWWLRGPNQNTFALPPFYTHRKGKDWALGLFPLFATGLFHGHHHTIIPPLLTWIDGDAHSRRTLIGPYFRWQKDDSVFWGVAPFLWNKRDDVDRYTVVPPFFFRFADDDPLSYTTVVPPFYHKRRKDLSAWGLPPLVFGKKTPELSSITVPLALFHHAHGPNDFRLVTPLLAYLDSKKDGRTWITPLYQRKRGDKNFDAVAPFYFHTWDNRDKSWGMVVPPFYWHWADPANDTTVVLPFVARRFREGISSTWAIPLLGRYKSFERDEQTWWIAPTFQYGWTETSWTFNIHPLFYLHKAKEKRHLAIAPIYYDFENYEQKTKRLVLFPIYWDFAHGTKNRHSRIAFPLYWDFENGRKQRRRIAGFPLYWDFQDFRLKKRSTVAFPVYFRFERDDRVRTVSLNTFHERKTDARGEHWQFHFFPLFAVGGGEQEKWWNVLYGLAGYDKRRGHRRVQALWIPFNLD
jgi:hypothetical protein